jgi:hypothetical protein
MTALNGEFIMAHNFSILMDVLVVREEEKELTVEYNDNKKAQIHAGFRGWLTAKGKGLMGLQNSSKFMLFLYNYFLFASSDCFHLIPSQLLLPRPQLSLTVYEILLIAH